MQNTSPFFSSINYRFLSIATDYFSHSRGERRKDAGKKFCLNRVSNSQSPGHESDTLMSHPGEAGKQQNKSN